MRQFIVSFFLLWQSSEAIAQQIDLDAIVRIEIEEERQDSSKIVVGTGSGAVIHEDGFVITARHVVEEAAEDGSGQTIYGRLRSQFGFERYPLTLVGFGTGIADIAVLQFPTTIKNNWDYLPFNADDMEVQDTFVGWGFPIGQDVQPIAGQVTLKEALIFRSNANFIYGMSGGPVLDSQGNVRGVIKGGSMIPGTNTIAPGLTFFVPIRLAGGLTNLIGADQNTPPEPNLPIEIVKNFDFSVTKDDHPNFSEPHSRIYGESIDNMLGAEPGYQITKCLAAPSSANNAHDIMCNVLPGGDGAQFRVRLESGPSYDKWRGWWSGTIALYQKKRLE